MDGATNQDEHAPGAVEPALAQSKSGLLDELLDLEGHSSGRPDPAVVTTGLTIGPTINLGTRVGSLVAWARGEAPKVEFPGNTRGPLSARSIIPLDAKLVALAIAERRGVLLTFEDGRPDAPIVTGILQPLVYVAAEPEPKPEPEPTPEIEPVPTPEPEQVPPPYPGPEIQPPMPQPEIEPPMPRPEIEPPMPQPEFEPPMREPEFEPPNPAPEVELDSETSGGISELEARVDGRRVEIEAADEIVLRCGQASIVLRRNGRVVIRGTYIETRSRGVNRVKGGSVEIN